MCISKKLDLMGCKMTRKRSAGTQIQCYSSYGSCERNKIAVTKTEAQFCDCRIHEYVK